MIRLIGIDVDGTLLDSSGQLPAENVAAIDEAVAAGIHVALVTGRSYPWTRPVADRLHQSVTLIVSNGAIQRTSAGETLERCLLPASTALDLLQVTRHARSSTALIFDRESEGQIVFESMDWGHPGRKGYFERNRALISQTVALEDALTEDPVEVMFSGGVRDMRAVVARITDRSGCAVSITEYVARDFTLVDVTALEATKGQALMRRARALGLTRAEVMAVGDNFNDLQMLEAAGLPVVMANAVPALKARGWAETGHQDQAGLAAAIRRFALS